jgi:hypothetical protein
MENKKVLVNGDDIFPMSELIKPVNEPEPIGITGLDCQVPGCVKKSVYGNIQVHLCEDHLHLGFKINTYRRPIPKVGRNENCLCGSKKKFKKCCGK